MSANIWTWGTGAAFGRELGIQHQSRIRRGHIATSIITKYEHFLIDCGAPCVETMVDNNSTIPDVLFITHSHNDHISDLDKFANNRKRSLVLSRNLGKKENEEKDSTFQKLPLICTPECLDDQTHGLKAKYGYLSSIIDWTVIPSYDVWYSISKSAPKLIPSRMTTPNSDVFNIEFKALPVYHAPHAPGACLFIFRIVKDNVIKKLVFSGDFESLKDDILNNEDLFDPSFILLETNTIYATGTNHTNWIQNEKLLNKWITGETKVTVLLNHLSGYEDWKQGFIKTVPTDKTWKNIISKFSIPNTSVDIAVDGGKYPI